MAEMCLILLLKGSLPGNCTDKGNFLALAFSLSLYELKFQVWLNSVEFEQSY